MVVDKTDEQLRCWIQIVIFSLCFIKCGLLSKYIENGEILTWCMWDIIFPYFVVESLEPFLKIKIGLGKFWQCSTVLERLQWIWNSIVIVIGHFVTIRRRLWLGPLRAGIYWLGNALIYHLIFIILIIIMILLYVMAS